MLSERIHVINGQLKSLQAQRETLGSELKEVLSAEKWDAFVQHTRDTERREFEKTKDRQVKKFSSLLSKSLDDKNCAVTSDKSSKWIVNISNRQLDEHETSVLQRGLNYAITSRRIPVENFIIETEKACRFLEPDTADMLRNEVVDILRKAKPTQSDITKKEKDAITRLKQDISIQVLPADKGRATVIMDKADYEAKVKSLLYDEKTYVKLDKDPTQQYKRKLVSILSRLRDEKKLSE